MAFSTPNFMAGADIAPAVFVKISADNTVIQCVADDEAIGVSHEGTRTAPIEGVTALTAKANEPVAVYTDTAPCEVEAAATIAAGDKLKPNADGKAIVALATEVYSAIAKSGAASGEKCKVIVTVGVV